MDKRRLILLILIIVSTLSLAALFPNEIMYYPRPQVKFSCVKNDYELSLSTRILLETFFKYKVKEPIVAGLMDTESSFIVHAISTSNALGPFQMKPFLAQEIGVLNPFNPYNDEKVYGLLNSYKNKLGSLDTALGAYHIGFYGTKKIKESGKNPLADARIKTYVNKNHEFQRLYNEGDWVTLKDYLWIDLRYSLGNNNRLSLTGIIPEFFLGSLALTTDYQSSDEITLDNFHFSVYQDFAFFYFMNLYIGYDDGVVAGCTLKSNDWFDRITLKYDFKKEDLIWEAYNSFGLFFMTYGFSKNEIYFSPGLEFDKKYCIAIRAAYRDFEFVPGIECTFKF